MTNHLKLKYRDIISLSFMIFSLFVGAGNIIFPPVIGFQAGECVWKAAVGFLITGVGLPILTVIALAKSGGNIRNLSVSIGRVASVTLSIVCNVTVGPLFAIPRTATVSFEVGIAPLTRNNSLLLFIYSLFYFLIVILVSLYPKKLLSTIGNFLAPLKIIALLVLVIFAIIYPAGPTNEALDLYKNSAFTNGFINGYLTMDALGAMVFSVVIVNSAYSRDIIGSRLLIRYIVLASLIAGIGLILLYLALFYLGSNSAILVDQGANGATILSAYVKHTFGRTGNFLLTLLIFISCLVTAVGLTAACAEFFSQYFLLSYRALVFFLGIFSMLISNFGLSHLIQISIPILKVVYPPCIVLIILSFTCQWWNNSPRVISSSVFISLIFSIFDGIKASTFGEVLPSWTEHLPLLEEGLVWLIPTIVGLSLLIIWDQVLEY